MLKKLLKQAKVYEKLLIFIVLSNNNAGNDIIYN